MTSRVLLSFLLWLGVLIVGCVEDEAERAQSAKALTERYEAALARRDLPRALEAVESLESVLPESPESSIVLARMLSRTGHLSEALWLLEAARRRYPDAPNIVLGIAETALLVSDAARALAAADEIGAEDPRHAYAQLLRSRAQLALGDLPAALLTLEQARLAHPENVELTKALIQALLAEGRSEEALSVVRDAQARGRGSEAFVRSIDLTEALILVGMNQVEAGVDALERIIAQNPTNVPAWQSLVKLMIARGETDEALRRVEVAVAVHPSTAEFYALLANLHASLGDPSSAEAAQRQLVDRVEGTAARISVANQLHAAGETDMAIEVLDAARTQVSISDAANVAYLRVAFLLDDGRMQNARSRFEEFERAFGGDIRGEYLRARFEFAKGDAQAAATRLRLVVAELDRADVQHWLGLALEAQGDLHGAEYRFGLAIERNRSQVASYLGLIRVFERRGAWREMGAAAAKLISIEPTHPYGYDALAQARFSLGQYAEAEEVLRSYANAFPSLVEPAVGLSSALRHQGNLEEALRVLDESEARFSDSPRHLAERAIVLDQLGRRADALALVEPAIEGGATDRALLRTWIYLLIVQNERDRAEAAAERSLALYPDDPTPFQMLGDHASMAGDWTQAQSDYRRYLEIRPGNPRVEEHLADALYRAGAGPEAIDAYRRVIELDDTAVRARNNLAQLLREVGRLDEALETAQAAYARAPEEVIVLDTLGWLFVAHGLPQRAVALLRKAHEGAPDSAEIQYHLAVAYREAGHMDEALTLLEALRVAITPNDLLNADVDAALKSVR